MSQTGLLPYFLTIILTAPCSVIYAATLDCSGGIISVGDSRVDLLMKCGDPDAKDSHDEEQIDRFANGSIHKIYVTIEEWTYNYGPTQFMRIVSLKNGKVAFIRAGNYGYSKETKPSQHECSEQIVSVGDSKSDVLAKCGEPTWKDTRQEEFNEKQGMGQVRDIFVTIEEWTYNLGSNRFVRILTFRNGKLFDIKSGNYGYEMKQEDKRKSP